MDEVLSGYEVNSATWFYLSLLLVIAVFFRFGRVWSLRNLDLALLLSISPALLLVREKAYEIQGYSLLFAISGAIMLRLCSDGWFVRRPSLEQNLNVPGLAFLCIATFAFLMTNVLAETPTSNTIKTVRQGKQIVKLGNTPAALAPTDAESKTAKSDEPEGGPTSSTIAAAVVASSEAVTVDSGTGRERSFSVEQVAARTMAVLAHFAVIAGLFVVGSRHFHSAQLGLAMATFYLLLPCTSYDVQKVNHVLPAALILWAFVAYRSPVASGSLMGLACGALFFPIFLLPLWAVFYGRRGGLRFGIALAVVPSVLFGILALTTPDIGSFHEEMFGEIEWAVLKLSDGDANGFWSQYNPAYGIPVFVAFLVILVVVTIWPRKKNLEHLMSGSTAIIVGTQFWYPQQGGVYVLWYLPLLLLVVFRPRLTLALPPDSSDTKTLSRVAGDHNPLAQAPIPAATTDDGHVFR